MEVREKDSRLFDRFPARFPVKNQHTREDYGTNVFLRDASAQGVRISSRDRMFKNDHVSLLVKLPDGKDPLVLNGRVAWTQQKDSQYWDVGLEFHKVNLMRIQRLFRLANTPSFVL